MSDIDDPRCIPHPRALSASVSGTSFSASSARRKRKALVSRHKYSQGRREAVEGAEDGRGAIRGEEGMRRRRRANARATSWAFAPPRSPHLCDQAKERDKLQKVEAQWRPAQPLPFLRVFKSAGICFDLLQVRTAYPRRNRRLHSGEVAARGCA
ncbi:hypothetical protein B0H13DRAFT_2167174 [Mycena leptocephala]|nr:hypothetical protein B0H13DRAFT_2167174 [Mycena leptocephala]